LPVAAFFVPNPVRADPGGKNPTDSDRSFGRSLPAKPVPHQPSLPTRRNFDAFPESVNEALTHPREVRNQSRLCLFEFFSDLVGEVGFRASVKFDDTRTFLGCADRCIDDSLLNDP
jgi:hypothetical protein